MICNNKEENCKYLLISQLKIFKILNFDENFAQQNSSRRLIFLALRYPYDWKVFTCIAKSKIFIGPLENERIKTQLEEGYI